MARRKNASTPKVRLTPASEDKPFPFEKLPAELRNAVYEFYFVREKPIKICRRRCPMIKTEDTITAESSEGTRTYTRTTKTRAEIKFNSGELDTPGVVGGKCITLLGANGASILRANKTINEEAISILYGSNKFAINSLPCMIEFMRSLGTHTKQLRHFRMDFVYGPDLAIGIKLLANVENLRVVEISVLLEHWCNSLHAVCKRLERAVKAFVSSGNSDIQRQRRFDQLKFLPNGAYNVNGDGSCLKDEKGQPIMEEEAAMNLLKHELRAVLTGLGLLQSAMAAT
ncbi:hypothetical protein LTR15_000549 [Elasticomyces elasticus]|nr:hypothetical protein LTR15_000549 [Elasticomyces elasticus]